MAEWLGSALQKQPQRFESASDLKKTPLIAKAIGGFHFNTNAEAYFAFFELKSHRTSEARDGVFFWGIPHQRITDRREGILKLKFGLDLAKSSHICTEFFPNGPTKQ